ncbi:MAG: 30S ribosomal protein S20 [Bacteroidota bacterium]
MKKLRHMSESAEAGSFLGKVVQMIDKLSKSNTWHKNKAANLKGKLTRFVNGLAK